MAGSAAQVNLQLVILSSLFGVPPGEMQALSPATKASSVIVM